MKNAISLSLTALALSVSAASQSFAAEQAESIAAAISGGEANLALRYRFEQVDQDGVSKKANASTLKTRISYKSLDYNDVQAVLEFDNNSVVLDNNHLRGNRPTIADGEYTDVNQAYLDYKGLESTTIRYGRQRINLDNQRHVGGVAWRQNEQTFDAITVVNTSLQDTTVILSNVMNINTITNTNGNGEDHQVLHINNKSIDEANVSAYALLLQDISDTYGIRATGKLGADDMKFNYAVEYATQEAAKVVDPSETGTDYLLLEAGVDVSGISAQLGLETLGSDKGIGFQTPLATKHKFNGWADKFLTTPGNGLEDLYLSVSTKQLGPKLALTYHQFDSNEGGVDYGSEIDLLVAHKFDDNYSGLIKFATYSQGDVGTPADTQKIWLQLEAKF